MNKNMETKPKPSSKPNPLALQNAAVAAIKSLSRAVHKLEELAELEDVAHPNTASVAQQTTEVLRTHLACLRYEYPEAAEYLNSTRLKHEARERALLNSEPVEVKDRRGYVDTYYLPKSGKGGNENG